jgi:hypothetical protein
MRSGPVRFSCALVAAALGLLVGPSMAAPADAQDAAAAETRPRRLLVFIDLDSAGFEPAQRIVLRESLLVALAGARADIYVVEAAEAAAAPATDSGCDEAARARKCDAWLAVSVRLTGESLRISRRIVDLAGGGQSVGAFSDETLPELRDLARGFWGETVQAVAAALPPLPGQKPGLVIRGIPGSRLGGLGGGEIILDESGQAAVNVDLPAAFNLNAEASGYYRLRESFLADQEGMIIGLKQAPLPRFAVSVGLLGGYLTAGFSWFPLPARIFLRADLVSFLMGFQLVSTQTSDGTVPPVFVSKKLVSFGLSAGAYFNGPDDDFRVYAGAGGGMRVMLGSVGGLEPIVPWQLSGLLGAEYSGLRAVKFFIEWMPLVYLPADDAWFRASSPRGAPYLRMLGGWMDPSSGVFGVRFYL